jgi:hypothetical protein
MVRETFLSQTLRLLVGDCYGVRHDILVTLNRSIINFELIRVYFRFRLVNACWCCFVFLRLDDLISMLHQRIGLLEAIKDVSHNQVFNWATF